MRVLFLDTVHEILEQQLTRAGWNCEHDYTCSYADLKGKLDRYDGLVVRSRLPLDAGMLAAAPKLKFIARSGAGLENIDLHAAEQMGIQVFNSPEGNRDAVGEQAVGMLLMLLNHLKRADLEVRQGVWRREENRGAELATRTVGIIGYGYMGSAFAEKLQGFGCRVIAYDKYKTLHPAGQAVTQVSLEELQRLSDVISLHLPQSTETHHFVNDAFIAGCSKSFVLINTARGSHVDTSALVRALASGAITGACLDVLEYEKRSFEGLDQAQLPEAFRHLMADERVVLSPHIAGWTNESYVKLSSVLADKILAAFT